MGYADMTITGAIGYRTPNLDRLAHDGALFTQYYSPAPVCSASRAGLLTGCYPARVGITGVLFPNSKKAEEVDYMLCLSYYKQSPKLELEQVNTSKAIGMLQSFISRNPESSRIAEATEIIDKCRVKLELKEYRAADLYYNLGQHRAAALSYTNLLNS